MTRVLQGAVPNPKPPGEGPSCLFQVLGLRSPSTVAVTLQSLPPSSHGLLCVSPLLITSLVIGFRAHPNLGRLYLNSTAAKTLLPIE